MNLLPLAQRLQDRGVGQVGTDIFVNFMPPDGGVILRDNFGGTPVNHYLPGYYRGSFMVIVRHSDAASALTLMSGAIAALKVQTKEQIGPMTFNYIRLRALPFTYAPSPAQQVEVAANFDACFLDAPA